MLHKARSETPHGPWQAPIQLLRATDSGHVGVLVAMVHHHCKHVGIEDECVGVHQEHIVGIDAVQRHVQCLAMGNVARLFARRLAFDQIDPVQ
ncbi:hypothetical protein D3C81_1466170 [compost metagenome]